MANPSIQIGIIGGSGLGEALGVEGGEQRTVDTPFGVTSSPLLLTRWQQVDVVILQRHGPGHTYNPTQVPYRANIYALKSLGVTHIVASGATGSLREHIHPGELVIPDQVIDRTFQRPRTFYDQAAVHVEMAEPFCPVVRQWLMDAGQRLDSVTIHKKGTYVCMEGPSFSTEAESNMHRAWGGDLIGMTCMPEAKLAREAEIAYGLVALPTDYDCWRAHDPNVDQQRLLAEILGNLKAASNASISLVKEAINDISMLEEQRSPAQDALKLAIWSDKTRIHPGEVERLRALWGRYF